MTDIVNVASICQLPPIIVQHDDSFERIQATTHRAQQRVAELVDILDERAIVLSSSGHFTLALQDTCMIRALEPLSPKGYLRAIQIYHEQGRQSAALALCEKGLITVPSSDISYDQLVLWKDVVEAANKKRVDLISQLPLDVVTTHIVPRIMDAVLGSSTASPYLYVSHTWRERFLLRPDGLEFKMEYKKPFSLKQGHDQLIRFAPFVRSLLVGQCRGARNHKLSELLSRANFRSLTHLEVSNTLALDRVAFLEALASVGNTLTHFKLQSIYQTNPLSIVLHEIVDACPNLVSLMARGIKTEIGDTRQYQQLKYLSLFRLSADSLGYDAMQDVLSRFPSLVSLNVGPMPDSRILPVVHDYCPLIQQLSLGSSSSSWDKTTISDNAKGLQQLAIGFGQSTCSQADVFSTLIRHRHSLKSLRLAGDVITSHHDPLPPLLLQDSHQPDSNDNIEPFMQLDELDFRYATNDGCIAILLWMIQHAPYITHIRLWHESNEHHPINTAITRLKHLQRACIDITSTERVVLPEFIQHHISLGSESSLEYLRIMFDGTPEDLNGLIPVTQLQQLQYLEIFSLDEIPSSYKPFMTCLAKQCSSLEELKLSSAQAEIDSCILEPLQYHPRLKRLTVLGTDLNQCYLLSLACFPKLEYFETWSEISHQVLEVLQTKIETIKFGTF
ncbi:hypothetical protein K492DRAFT_236776 [Lichtheimia hyalospora FSU 10163]|nr:hypothetical protein K492DRAFT_236776 [Lichtheimia hyalospora FSU 10163]